MSATFGQNTITVPPGCPRHRTAACAASDETRERARQSDDWSGMRSDGHGMVKPGPGVDQRDHHTGCAGFPLSAPKWCDDGPRLFGVHGLGRASFRRTWYSEHGDTRTETRTARMTPPENPGVCWRRVSSDKPAENRRSSPVFRSASFRLAEDHCTHPRGGGTDRAAPGSATGTVCAMCMTRLRKSGCHSWRLHPRYK